MDVRVSRSSVGMALQQEVSTTPQHLRLPLLHGVMQHLLLHQLLGITTLAGTYRLSVDIRIWLTIDRIPLFL